MKIQPDKLMAWAQQFLPGNPRQGVNFDALRRELIHAVHANLQEFESDKDVYAPSDFQVFIAEQDADQLTQQGLFDLFREKLRKIVQEHIGKRGFKTNAPVSVHLSGDRGLEAGYLRVEISFKQRDHNIRRTIIRPPMEETLAVLEAMNGPRKGQQIPLTRAVSLIGRLSEESHPEIGIEDSNGYVSRKHAEIERRGACFTLRDLQSANGTWLVKPDGSKERVEKDPLALESGMVIAVADEYLLKFVLQDRCETQVRVP